MAERTAVKTRFGTVRVLSDQTELLIVLGDGRWDSADKKNCTCEKCYMDAANSKTLSWEDPGKWRNQ